MLATLAEVMPEVLDDLVGPALPQYTNDAWHAFLSLCGTRSVGQHGGNAITYEEIDAYQRVTGMVLTPLDVQCIKAGDAVVMALQHEQLRRAADRTPQSDVPNSPAEE